MEKQIGKYSQNEAKKYLKKGTPFLFIWAFLFLIGLDYLPFYINFGSCTNGIYFIGGMLCMYGVMQFIVPFEYWKSGLKGEKIVINNLSKNLNNYFSLFNDVLLKYPNRGGNIDHIVVGPTGIFVLETKNNQGKIVYDQYGWKGIGSRNDPVRQVNNNMIKLKNLLKSCIVFRDSDPYLRQAVIFSNPKAEIRITKEPYWGCKVFQIKSLDDPVLANFIYTQNISFSEQEVRDIVLYIRGQIGNYE